MPDYVPYHQCSNLHKPQLTMIQTDANIDASCNRTHYGSNWLACVDKIQLST
jgi:hypothetical protein